MATRSRPVMVGARVTHAEKRAIELVCEAEGKTVSIWIHQLIVPEARRRLSRELAQGGAGEALLS